MQYDKTDDRILATLDVVAKYDPELYRRMMRDDWTATFSFAGLSQAGLNALNPPFGVTFGATLAKACEAYRSELNGDAPGRTTLNERSIEWKARNMRVPFEMFAASVLAHEYAHIVQPQCGGPGAEPPAFEEGTRFARKLPAPYGERIAQLSEESEMQNIVAALLGH